MHWTAGFRLCFILSVTGPPSVMCVVRQLRTLTTMKTLFTTPVWWSEEVVGTWPRFSIALLFQAAGVLLACSVSEWRRVGPIVLFGFVVPLYYLIALRGVVRELRRKPDGHENVVA